MVHWEGGGRTGIVGSGSSVCEQSKPLSKLRGVPFGMALTGVQALRMRLDTAPNEGRSSPEQLDSEAPVTPYVRARLDTLETGRTNPVNWKHESCCLEKRILWTVY